MDALKQDRPVEADEVAGRVGQDGVHRIEIEVSHRTPERTFYRVWFRGAELLVHADPEPAACRALRARGMKGKLVTRWKGAEHDASIRDIEAGAQLCSSETRKSGPRTVKYVPFEDRDLEPHQRQAIAA